MYLYQYITLCNINISGGLQYCNILLHLASGDVR